MSLSSFSFRFGGDFELLAALIRYVSVLTAASFYHVLDRGIDTAATAAAAAPRVSVTGRHPPSGMYICAL